MLVPALPAELVAVSRGRLEEIENLHINILNQNILKMPGPESVDALKQFTRKVTMTTAHERYCTEEMSRKYRITTHHLSTYGSPEQYRRRAYAEKTNLMIVSPDEHPMKAAILGDLQKKLPGLAIQVIRNLTYGDYKATIEKAKWAVTFGEGADGYFSEPIFSGGISFAVYNEDFCPVEFKALPTVFGSYEQMRRELPAILEKLDNPSSYNECHASMFDLQKKRLRHDAYLKNLQAFYQGHYDIEFQGD